MPFMELAVQEAEAHATSVPIIRPEDEDAARRLRAAMVPHVIRGLLPTHASGGRTNDEIALALLKDVQGALKATHNVSNDGLIESYFGPEREAPLRDFLDLRADGYWLTCVETRGFDAAATAAAAAAAAGDGGDESESGSDDDASSGARHWLGRTADKLARHALLGLTRSSASELCVRVSRGRSRVQPHSDAWHGLLAQVGGGQRSVLLWMPDTAGLLGAAYVSDGSGGHVPVSDNDPRRAGEMEATSGFRRAPTLVATLQAGDALHIPCAWFHYIESGRSTPPVAADEGKGLFSVAVSVRTRTETVADETSLWDRFVGARVPEGFVEVPCEQGTL